MTISRTFVAFLMLAISACSDSNSGPTGATTTSIPPMTANLVESSVDVVERNQVFWAFSWRATIDANAAGRCSLTVKYLNGDGVELDEGFEILTIRQGRHQYTGRTLIDVALAPNVTQFRMTVDNCTRT